MGEAVSELCNNNNNNDNDDDGLYLLDVFGTLLSDFLYALTHLFFILPADVDTINTPILQMKKLRLEVTFSKSHSCNK